MPHFGTEKLRESIKKMRCNLRLTIKLGEGGKKQGA
jgi:hypothetical protein